MNNCTVVLSSNRIAVASVEGRFSVSAETSSRPSTIASAVRWRLRATVLDGAAA